MASNVYFTRSITPESVVEIYRKLGVTLNLKDPETVQQTVEALHAVQAGALLETYSPSEDIAESFAYFVLYDQAEGESLQARKQNFFYAYPELVTFRDQARARMGL